MADTTTSLLFDASISNPMSQKLEPRTAPSDGIPLRSLIKGLSL